VVSQATTAPLNLTGPQLYLLHCAGCHGERGDGKGIASFVLFPKPRDFRAGRFRLVSTENLVPRPEDLETVITRGMPGSSMPSWPNLSQSERQLLVREVQKLYHEGIRDSYIAQLKEEEGDDFKIDEADVQEYLKKRTTPSEIVAAPKITAADETTITHGREIYQRQGCGSCHGTGGKGDGQQNMVDSEGLPTRPRDLTRGIFKGSDEPTAVYLRLKLGLPGTPMPSSGNLTDVELVDLTHYLLSLSTKEARQSAVLNRERIVARHVAKLPVQPNDVAWKDVKPALLRLTPLWWRDDAVSAIEVQAAHDGQQIALRLVWNDANADRFASRTEAFKDGVAAELVTGSTEPFLGMGAKGTPVDVWMWDADRDNSGGDVEDVYPRVVVDGYPLSEKLVESPEYQRPGTKTENQDPLTIPAQAVGNPIVRTTKHPSGGTAMGAAGPGTGTFRLAKSQLVSAHGQWQDGRWSVVMTRTLAVNQPADGVQLTPGQTASIAFAVWDGSHRDRNGQKQISIWQGLELEANPR
jgi:mono/diheme cytochrome c family protein